MAILDINKADFIEYIPPSKGTVELNIVRIHRCYDWFDKNVPILENFWKSVEYWRQNDITTHPEYESYISHLNNIINPKPKKILNLDNLTFLNEEESNNIEFLDDE